VITGAPVIAGADRPGRASGSRSIRVRGPWWSPITMVEPDYGMERCPCGRRSCALPDARCRSGQRRGWISRVRRESGTRRPARTARRGCTGRWAASWVPQDCVRKVPPSGSVTPGDQRVGRIFARDTTVFW